MVSCYLCAAEASAWPLLVKATGLCKQKNHPKKQQYSHFSIPESKQAA